MVVVPFCVCVRIDRDIDLPFNITVHFYCSIATCFDHLCNHNQAVKKLRNRGKHACKVSGMFLPDLKKYGKFVNMCLYCDMW
jgi:hypothetical protein